MIILMYVQMKVTIRRATTIIIENKKRYEERRSKHNEHNYMNNKKKSSLNPNAKPFFPQWTYQKKCTNKTLIITGRKTQNDRLEILQLLLKQELFENIQKHDSMK